MRYIRFSPDYWAYEQIAKNYKAAGDLTRWESTLEDYLIKAEEHGLTHAQVRVELARHFMEKKQWDKAWPYGQGGRRGVGCAMGIDVRQRMRRLQKRLGGGRKLRAEPQPAISAVAGGATGSLFCMKTGHGDAAAAQAFVEDYLKPIKEQPERAATGPRSVTFTGLPGIRTNAMLWFRHAYASSPSVYTCFNLITLADETGDTVTREEAIRLLLGKAPQAGARWRPGFMRSCEEGLNQGPAGSPGSEGHRRNS